MRLQVKLLAIVATLSILPGLGLGVAAYLELRQQAVDRLVHEARTVSQQVARHVASRIEAAEANARLFADAYIVERYMLTADQVERYQLILPALLDLFATYQRTYPEFVEFRIVLPDGTVDARLIGGDASMALSDEQVVREIGGPTEYGHQPHSVIVRDDAGQPRLLSIRPISLQDRRISPLTAPIVLRGYLVATVDLRFIDTLLTDARIGRDGHLLLVGTDHQVLFDEEATGWQMDADLANRLRAAAVSGDPISADHHGIAAVMGSELPRSDLMLVWTMPEAEFVLAARRLAAVVAAVIAVTILATCVLFYWALRRMVLSPVASLMEAVGAISNGRLQIDVPVKTRDEMGALARAFEAMGSDLHNSQEQLRARSSELEVARDRAEDANRAKSQFLATMSHEIRTPINGVLGMAELLGGTELTDQQRSFLVSIQMSGEALLHVVNDILDVSKIESGSLHIENEAFDLRSLMAGVDEMMRPQAITKGLHYASEVAPEIAETVVGDIHRLRQVLLNLLGNAVKFTPSGRIAVRVSLISEDDQTARVLFEVEDTGIGVHPSKKASIFQAFTQADGTFTRRFGGAGLGLAICHRLVTLMDGEIGVDDGPGQGSRFWFKLPLAKASAPAHPTAAPPMTVATPQPEAPVAGRLGGTTVLVVDDDTISQEICVLMLEGLGCTVDAASSGRAALSKTAERQYDLVLLDCSMPDLDGFETVRRLRQREQKDGAARTPVVAATANAFEEDRHRCLEAGMDDYLRKPFGTAELRIMLKKWTGDRRSGRPADAMQEARR